MSTLNSRLRRLGSDKLTKLYGGTAIEAISNILQDGVNEIKLVELLNIKYGRQILSNRDIRTALYLTLSNDERFYMLYGHVNSQRELDKEELLSLSKLKWGRKLKTSHRLIEILKLDETYLPEENSAPPSKETIEPNFYLFDHQKRVKDNFVRTLSNGSPRVLIHMPTGAGKTRTCVEGIIDYLKANADRKKIIFWLAHSEELCEQAVETIKNLWKTRGDSSINIYRLWGQHDVPSFSENNEIGFVVAGFQKLTALLKSNDNAVFKNISKLKGNVELLVVDEAHKAIAPTYRQCIEYLFQEGVTKLVGLTATPGRETDFVELGRKSVSETQQLAEFFGSNKIGLTDAQDQEVVDPIGYLQDQGFLSKINRKKVTTNISLELSEKEKLFVADFLELPPSVLKRLAQNDERNALILAEIASLYKKGSKTIVFALSVEHAHLITELLNLKGISSKCIDGNTPPSERADIISSYKNNEISVLTNFGVLTTGFDAPNTNAVVIARPTQSLVLYSQMIGRGIRGPRVGGNEKCSLVDLEDNLIGFPSEKQAFNYFDLAWGK